MSVEGERQDLGLSKSSICACMPYMNIITQSEIETNTRLTS